MAVQVLVWPIGFLSARSCRPRRCRAGWRRSPPWNPLSATAVGRPPALRQSDRDHRGSLVDGAVLAGRRLAAVLTAIFLPLSARAYRNLAR